jgi:putative ABC transport system permease protein
MNSPRLAAYLLARLLPRDCQHDVILGDMLEEFRRRARLGPRSARFWYWREAFSILFQTYGYRNMRLFDHLRQDVRFALRSSAKTPGFTAIVVLTLALGVGASTAIFSAVNGILLKPLPFPEPDRLFWINEVAPDGRTMTVSWPNYVDWTMRAHSFAALAASRWSPFTWTGHGEAKRLDARRVTGHFFAVLGVQPAAGRGFSSDDDRPGSPPVAIVTHEFASRYLNTDAEALGRALTLDDRSYTVVGVLPPGFRYLRSYDLFVAMGPFAGDPMLLDRGNHAGYLAIARLRRGATEAAARDELKTIEASLSQAYPNVLSGVTVMVEPLAAQLVTSVRETLLVLFGAVTLLLLIACVNVANLLIARGAARGHELAVRSALGSSRARLAMQLLVESSMLSGFGGALGIGIAIALLRLLVSFAPEGTPRIDEVRLDDAALLFAVGTAMVCGMLFGAFPAVHGSGIDAQQTLARTRGAGASASTNRLRRGLLAVEVALALVLLTGAGLMVRTLERLTGTDPGFSPDHLLTAHLSVSGDRWTPERCTAFADEALQRIGALPGVTHAAAVSALAIDGSDWNSVFVPENKPLPPRREDLPSSAFTIVTPAYFQTMETALERGRVFDDRDRTGKDVILINETLARTIWPGENPIGKRLKQGWPEWHSPWREVVGVVRDVKFQGVAERTPMQTYLPFGKEIPHDFFILARTAGDPAGTSRALEAAVHGIDRDLPVYDLRPMTQVMASDIAQQRMAEIVLTMFAAVALTLAAIGLYGLVAHSVTARTHEIGLRMALGAEPGAVVRLIVRGGLSIVMLGAAVGLGGAAALAGLLRGMLFGIQPLDPLTFASGVALLLATATVACVVPAWRAVRIPPTMALRAE